MIGPRPAVVRPAEPAGRGRRGTGSDRLDAVDEAIVRQLQDDGRRPFREIARSLGVSEATVRARFRRLADADALRIVAVADPFRLGFQVLAFVLLKLEPGRGRQVIEMLTPWPEITYISSLTGRADVYIQVVCHSHDDLWELLSERLPAIPGIEGTETFMELKMHKVAYRYPTADGGPDDGAGSGTPPGGPAAGLVPGARASRTPRPARRD